jgi:hypothetical protein
MRLPKLLFLALPVLLAFGACRVEPVEPGGGTPSPRLTGNQETDRGTLERLDREAAALAHTEGCASSGECRSAPVGSRPCGGPRHYLPYCPLTTDVPALERKLAQIEAFERAFNEKYQLASTCEFRTPPELEVVGGACRAATGGR